VSKERFGITVEDHAYQSYLDTLTALDLPLPAREEWESVYTLICGIETHVGDSPFGFDSELTNLAGQTLVVVRSLPDPHNWQLAVWFWLEYALYQQASLLLSGVRGDLTGADYHQPLVAYLTQQHLQLLEQERGYIFFIPELSESDQGGSETDIVPIEINFENLSAKAAERRKCIYRFITGFLRRIQS
jgi:hypothetical protein